MEGISCNQLHPMTVSTLGHRHKMIYKYIWSGFTDILYFVCMGTRNIPVVTVWDCMASDLVRCAIYIYILSDVSVADFKAITLLRAHFLSCLHPALLINHPCFISVNIISAVVSFHLGCCLCYEPSMKAGKHWYNAYSECNT